jgi:protein involved in temperature-dependent protein secretion
MIVSYGAVVGADFFKQNRGHFWLIANTRPYMMLKYRRAQLKFAHGDLADAISEFQDLISLNPEDNQNVRSILASMLIMAADWSRLSQLLNEYNEDEGLALEASRALMLYANEGDSEAARVAKKRMHSANKHAVKYLTGQTKSKGLPEMYSLGQASEAEVYLGDFGKEAWRSVAGALFWLRRK